MIPGAVQLLPELLSTSRSRNVPQRGQGGFVQELSSMALLLAADLMVFEPVESSQGGLGPVWACLSPGFGLGFFQPRVGILEDRF